MGELAERFVAEEGGSVKSLLQHEITTRSSGSRYFTFDVFNIRIDVSAGSVTVEDVLDPDAEETMTLAAFADELARC